MNNSIIPDTDIRAINHLARTIRHWGRNEKLRQVAADIVSVKNNDGSWAVAEWDNMATISAVYVWVDKKIRYTTDPITKDVWENPFQTLKLKIADCDGYLILIGSLLECIGYPVAVAMTSQSLKEPLNHVYLLVGTPPLNPPKLVTSWLPIDAIVDKPIGWQPPYAYGIWRRVR